MIYSIVLTPQAKTDLGEIFRYIAVELQSMQNAEKQLTRLQNAIASLDQMPERYRVYDRPQWKKPNLRVMPVDNYLVFYIPTHDNSTVTVLRVMYGGRDVDKQLNLHNNRQSISNI